MAHSSSIVCGVADDQIDQLISAIILPESWMDRILAQVLAVDEVQRISESEKKSAGACNGSVGHTWTIWCPRRPTYARGGG